MKNKKIISILLCILMFCSSISVMTAFASTEDDYREITFWKEDFEGYTDSDIGKAPSKSPYCDGEGGNKTVQYEDDKKENTVLNFTCNQDASSTKTLRMKTETLSGDYSVSFRFKVPEIYTSLTYEFIIRGYDSENNKEVALVKTRVEFSSKTKGSIYLSKLTDTTGEYSAENVYALTNTLEADTWYKMTYYIDSATDTFTYALNDEASNYVFSIEDYPFNSLCLQKYSGTGATSATILVDDMVVSQLAEAVVPKDAETSLAWSEDFENYVESDVGKAPYLSPYSSGAENDDGIADKVIAYEDEETKLNKTLKYTCGDPSVTNVLKMTDKTQIDGCYSVSFRFKVPELYTSARYRFQIVGNNGSGDTEVIGTYVDFDASGNGSLYTQVKPDADGSNQKYYAVESGNLVDNTWYKMTYYINSQTQKFYYVLNDGEESLTYDLTASGTNYPFKDLRLNKTSSYTATDETTIFVDDMVVMQYLSVKEPVNEMTMSVYKGDSVTLPSTVPVLMSDNKTISEKPVTWSESVNTSATGTQTITGTVEGSATEARLPVTVKDVPYEIIAPVLKDGSEIVMGIRNNVTLSTVKIKQISNSPFEGNMYAALYSADDKLVDIKSVVLPPTGEYGDEKEVSVALTMNYDNDVNLAECKLRLFAISDNLTPHAVSFDLDNAEIPEATTIYIAGDSTACEKVDKQRPEYGWGEMFSVLCEGTDITVSNQAMGSRSSKSFYDEGRLRTILSTAKAGDYLLFQFGHNDANTKSPRDYADAEPGGVYEQYMSKYVEEARAKGVNPVIVTPICLATYSGGVFNGHNNSDMNLTAYADAAKRVAAAYDVPVIDILSLTYDAFSTMSKEELYQYYDWYVDGSTTEEGNKDYIHLNQKGAELVAGMVKEEMQRLLMPVAKLWNN